MKQFFLWSLKCFVAHAVKESESETKKSEQTLLAPNRRVGYQFLCSFFI